MSGPCVSSGVASADDAPLADATGALRVVVLADTHVASTRHRPGWGPGGLPDTVWAHLEGAGAVLHAGDVLDAGVLDAIRARVPTWAVLGNNDHSLVGVLPATRTVVLGGVRIGMIHDAGPRAGRSARLGRRFPDAQVVVFGHSHEPCDEEGDGPLLFNPGSPTQRRAQPTHTLGELVVGDGRVIAHRIVVLDPPG